MISTLLFLAMVAIVPSGETFQCTPTRVWDGDGPIWCSEGARIRLSGIAAREMDGTCRKNHPCPKAGAEDARDALVRLIGKPIGRSREGHILVKGPTMTCKSEGGAGGNRTSAWCISPVGGDLSCGLVNGGWALRWSRYWKTHQCKKYRSAASPHT
jgi:endonuclease YncB( thermonuclease family)